MMDILTLNGLSTILSKILSEKLRDQANLDKAKRLWYLVLRIFLSASAKSLFCSDIAILPKTLSRSAAHEATHT